MFSLLNESIISSSLKFKFFSSIIEFSNCSFFLEVLISLPKVLYTKFNSAHTTMSRSSVRTPAELFLFCSIHPLGCLTCSFCRLCIGLLSLSLFLSCIPYSTYFFKRVMQLSISRIILLIFCLASLLPSDSGLLKA